MIFIGVRQIYCVSSLCCNLCSFFFSEKSTSMPCRPADFSSWDKLFVALEDSHMRQNMLLDSLGQCCGGMASLRTQLDKLVKGKGLPSLEWACRPHVEQLRLLLQQGLLEVREEEARRERNLNATLQQLLRRSHEGNLLLKTLEESWGHRATSSGGAESKLRHRPTQTPGASGPKQASPLLKEQATVEKALVAIATELQTVHLQLSRVIEQVGTPRKGRGDA